MNNELIEPEIPSFVTFRKEIMNIYPEGDLTEAYETMLWHIKMVKQCADGTPISYRLIMDKFASHISQWNVKYGSRDPKYIGKADEEKRKDLLSFIDMKGYEREFTGNVGQNGRNKYLFGEFTQEYLQKQLKEFKREIPDETDISEG
jgi:hypothetical protein